MDQNLKIIFLSALNGCTILDLFLFFLFSISIKKLYIYILYIHYKYYPSSLQQTRRNALRTWRTYNRHLQQGLMSLGLKWIDRSKAARFSMGKWMEMVIGYIFTGKMDGNMNWWLVIDVFLGVYSQTNPFIATIQTVGDWWWISGWNGKLFDFLDTPKYVVTQWLWTISPGFHQFVNSQWELKHKHQSHRSIPQTKPWLRSIRLGAYFEQHGMGFVIVLDWWMVNCSWLVEVRLLDYHLPWTISMCFFCVLSELPCWLFHVFGAC